MERRQIARQHDADLVGENLLALVVDDSAAVAVAVEAEREVGAVSFTAAAIACSISISSGFGL